MKNILSTIGLCLYFVLFVQGQDSENFAISIQRAKSDFGSRTASTFQKYCSELFADDFEQSKSSIIKLHPRIKSTGGSLIEGMESVTSSETELQLILQNIITKEKVEWKWPFAISGSNINKVVLDTLIQLTQEDTKLGKSMLEFVQSYIDKEFGNNCQAYLDSASTKASSGNYLRAIQIASAIPQGANCFTEATQLVKTSFDQYQSELCGKNLYEAQLDAAAGRYERAIGKLYCIAYDAPCAAEALAVAKDIADKSSAGLKSRSQGNLSNIVIYLNGGRSSSWYQSQLRRLRYQ